MALKLTSPDQIASLNKWADRVDAKLDNLDSTAVGIGQVTSVATTVATDISAIVTTPPPQATGISVSENGLLIDGNIYSEVSITYTAPADITYFAGVFLVVANYLGSSSLVKVSEHNYLGLAGGTGTFKVNLQRTGETVTFFAVAKNISGVTNGWASAPSDIAVLDGNASAPNPPTGLAAGVTSLAVNLTWNSNVETNIKGYDVYRNTINNSGSAVIIGSAPSTGSSATVNFLDKAVTVGTTYYYWVQAINNAGMSSGFSAVASTTPPKLNLDDADDGAVNVNFLAVQRAKGIDIAGNLLLKNVANSDGTTPSPTKTSASSTVIPEMTQTITTSGNKVLAVFTMTFNTSTNNSPGVFRIMRDGTISSLAYTVPSNSFGSAFVTISWIDSGASSGSHTYAAYWAGNAAYTITAGTRALQVVELG